jgi:4-amino-4-deoxy-L-arabinose transferase-like glycosyltransferase
MLASGEWFIPRVGGEVYADKPPLYFWLMAAWMHVTGSVRAAFLLPSLIASLGSVVLVYDLARRLWNRHTALIAGTLLLLTVQFVWQARQAQIDATLCFWTTLSLYALLRHLLLGPTWGWYVVGWAAAGLGVLTKGVGFLPLLIFIPWLILQKRWALPALTGSMWNWALGPLAFVSAVSVWLVPLLMLSMSDPVLAAYRDEILFKQTVERYVDAWHHLKPFWYFLLEVIPFLWLPLIVLLPWLIPRWRDAMRAHSLAIALLLSYVAMVVLFFSLSAGKRGVYVLPAVPAFVLACAPFVLEIVRRAAVQRVTFALIAMLGLGLGTVAFYLLIDSTERWEVSRTYGLDPLAPLVLMSITIGLLCVLMRRREVFGLYAAAMCAVMMVVSYWVNPALNEVRSGQAFVSQIETYADPRKDLGLLAFKEQYLLHIQRPVVHFGHARWRQEEQEAADAALWLNSKPGRQLIVTGLAKDRCFQDAQAAALGSANRREWFLLAGETPSPCVARGEQGAGQLYVPPTSAPRIDRETKLLSRNGAHHLRTKPSTIRAERITQHGE